MLVTKNANVPVQLIKVTETDVDKGGRNQDKSERFIYSQQGFYSQPSRNSEETAQNTTVRPHQRLKLSACDTGNVHEQTQTNGFDNQNSF